MAFEKVITKETQKEEEVVVVATEEKVEIEEVENEVNEHEISGAREVIREIRERESSLNT